MQQDHKGAVVFRKCGCGWLHCSHAAQRGWGTGRNRKQVGRERDKKRGEGRHEKRRRETCRGEEGGMKRGGGRHEEGRREAGREERWEGKDWICHSRDLSEISVSLITSLSRCASFTTSHQQQVGQDSCCWCMPCPCPCPCPFPLHFPPRLPTHALLSFIHSLTPPL